MARIFITGSLAGLGLMAAQLLISQSHEVVLHGRNQERADAALASAPGAGAAVTGDLARLSEMRSVAGQVNRFGHDRFLISPMQTKRLACARTPSGAAIPPPSAP